MGTARLIYAASESDADLLYATRLSVPDPFVWFQTRGRTRVALSPMEVDRARRVCRETGRVDEVLAAADFLPEKGDRGAAALITALAGKYRFDTLEVPENFPLGLAETLRERGLTVRARPGLFFPEREIKDRTEIVHITAALRAAEAGMEQAFAVLKQSTVGKGNLLRWRGAPLTSERLRGEIDAVIMKAGATPAGTIVAGGEQACDPHERGHGPLRAHQAIILDIFPRSQRTGYFGDLTRTVVKGRPSATLEKLYDTVAEGKRWVMARTKAGADGAALHQELTARFAQAGYPTEKRQSDGRWVGFFHGTGHSLGLEIHEPPRFGAGKFRAGHVMTIEPGLYFPGIGGVRLEDLVVIGVRGARNLTRVAEKLRVS
jgi:Xaa-Pro aminopeptidase